MNKFLMEVINFNEPIANYSDSMLRSKCDGLSVYQVMEIGKAILKLNRVSADLQKLVYDTNDMIDKAKAF